MKTEFEKGFLTAINYIENILHRLSIGEIDLDEANEKLRDFKNMHL